MKVWTLHFIGLIVLGSCTVDRKDNLEQECLHALSEAATSSGFWVRVHGIEYLTALGYYDEAKTHVAALSEFEREPQKRIGFWRCQYQLSQPEDKAVWLQRITDAYTDSTGPDRIHAAETLSKLRVPLRSLDTALVTRDMNSGGMLTSFVKWGSALPRADEEGRIGYQQLLDEFEQDEDRRKIAAYALSHVGHLPDEAWSSVAVKALKEPPSSKAYPYMINAAFSLQPDNAGVSVVADSLYDRLISLKDIESKEARVEMCRGLAAKGGMHDLGVLSRLLRNEMPLVQGTESSADPSNVDVRATAAFAIISIIGRHNE